MICDLQVWIELRSISAYHFWSSIGTLVHVNLHWHGAKVCNHSLPMPSPRWWITMKEVSSQDPKEAPLCQGTVGARDSLGARSSGGSPGWQGPAARGCPTIPARSRADEGSPGGWHGVLGYGLGGEGGENSEDGWAGLLEPMMPSGPWHWYYQRSLSTVQLLVFSLLMNISQEHRN